MKKIMLAIGLVACVASSQAANVTWNSTAYASLPSGACSGTIGSGDVKMFVWQFTAETWNSSYESASGIWNAVKGGTLDLAQAQSNVQAFYLMKDNVPGAATIGDVTLIDGQQIYAAILYLHDDTKTFTTDSSNYYLANWATAKASNASTPVNNLGTTIGGDGLPITGQGGATLWQATAVPEPTSGLLLLLGVAGLALKRRRA